MKTPMQELYHKLCEYRKEETSPLLISRFNSLSVEVLTLIKKEKEVIMDAFQEGKWDGWQNHKLKVNDKEIHWTDPADYYNKTFNTKVK